MRGAAFAALAMMALLGGGAGCGDKSNPNAGDGGVAAHLRDGGPEGGTANANDGGPSPDDLVMPQATSDELVQRMRHLLEAVSQENAELAGDVLFPRDAYLVVRDAADPQKAWEKKVQGTFKRAVERTHKRNKGIETAHFQSFELGHQIVQLTVKKRDFKRPLWRVKHSKLTFTTEGGKVRHLDIAEMTAWRGAWYVTRLR